MHTLTPAPAPEAVDLPVPPRLLLAALWVCHFILWIFGDMFTLLQGEAEPVETLPVQLLAVTTAVVLVAIVVTTLTARARTARRGTLVAAPVYLAFDLGFLFEATQAWEVYLGLAYLAAAGTLIWRAHAWTPAR